MVFRKKILKRKLLLSLNVDLCLIYRDHFLNCYFTMHKQRSIFILLLFICSTSICQTISRKAVFERHQVQLNHRDSLNSLSVGNGSFAMTVDITGLQTFPDYYQKGIPLGTLSDWGWHSFPNTVGYDFSETLRWENAPERKIPYAVQSKNARQAAASNYFRQNPHRIHLAQLGWILHDTQNNPVAISDLKNIQQTLNPYTGVIFSSFTVDQTKVTVETLALQEEDAVLVKVKSELISRGSLGVKLNFPYPTDEFLDEATHYNAQESKRLQLKTLSATSFSIQRQLDRTLYFSHFQSSTALLPLEKKPFGYAFFPDSSEDTWEFKIAYAPQEKTNETFDYAQEKSTSIAQLSRYWERGAILDFSATQDPQAFELERRMVLSRYLRKVNCSAPNPPQETGLTFNSWYGKPHIEMHWWHLLPFALWGNTTVFEEQLEWYFTAFDGAKRIAARQGYKGVRWQKMTDIWGGETASSVGSYLIWQQPHLLYFAEWLYRQKKDAEILSKYKYLVEETAAFMADYLRYDSTTKRYNLGPFLIPSQESYPSSTTLNPAFELTYWKWGLETAQLWRERLGQKRNPEWDNKLEKMAPLPGDEHVYWAVESAPYPYDDPEQLRDHPSVLATYSIAPLSRDVHTEKMKNTLERVETNWRWDTSWGWDFPMAAMTATRLQLPEKAVAFLLKEQIKNTYLKNGHNFQDDRLRLYLPGNGGLLIALARMATQSDGNGFPKSWSVQSEGFLPDIH